MAWGGGGAAPWAALCQCASWRLHQAQNAAPAPRCDVGHSFRLEHGVRGVSSRAWGSGQGARARARPAGDLRAHSSPPPHAPSLQPPLPPSPHAPTTPGEPVASSLPPSPSHWLLPAVPLGAADQQYLFDLALRLRAAPEPLRIVVPALQVGPVGAALWCGCGEGGLALSGPSHNGLPLLCEDDGEVRLAPWPWPCYLCSQSASGWPTFAVFQFEIQKAMKRPPCCAGAPERSCRLPA